MIPQGWCLLLLLPFLSLATSQDKAYDDSDWIPISPSTTPPKKAEGRVLNIDPPNQNFFPPAPEYVPKRPPPPFLLPQFQKPPKPQQPYKFETPQYVPQPYLQLEQAPPPQFLPPQQLVAPAQNNPNFYNVEKPPQNLISLNQELLGAIQNQNLKENINEIRTTTQRPKDDRQNVQLLYVPLENLNRNQPKFQNIENDFISQALAAHKLQQQISLGEPIELQTTTPTTTTTQKPKKRKANQPPLAVYMEKEGPADVKEVLHVLKNAKSISVQDSVGPESPKVFVGPSNINPEGYTKFPLPYLSSLQGNRIERKVEQLPFFVAPLSYKTPDGYSKIPLPSPHVGSVVVSNKEKSQPQRAANNYLSSSTKSFAQEEYYQPSTRTPDVVNSKLNFQQSYNDQYQDVRPANVYTLDNEPVRSTTPLLTPQTEYKFVQKPEVQQNPYGQIINQYEIEQINSQLGEEEKIISTTPPVRQRSRVRQRGRTTTSTTPNALPEENYTILEDYRPKTSTVKYTTEVETIPAKVYQISDTPTRQQQEEPLNKPSQQFILETIQKDLPLNKPSQPYYFETTPQQQKELPVRKNPQQYFLETTEPTQQKDIRLTKPQQQYYLEAIQQQEKEVPSSTLPQQQNYFDTLQQPKEVPTRKHPQQYFLETTEATQQQQQQQKDISLSNSQQQYYLEAAQQQQKAAPSNPVVDFNQQLSQTKGESEEDENVRPLVFNRGQSQESDEYSGLISNLQDQAIRHLLVPNLLVPTEKTIQHQQQQQQQIVEEIVPATTTTTTTTTTQAPIVETTTQRRTRGRVRANSSRYSTTTAPRRRRPNYTRPTTEQTTETVYEATKRTTNQRQRFRTRGRPVQTTTEAFVSSEAPLKEYHQVYNIPQTTPHKLEEVSSTPQAIQEVRIVEATERVYEEPKSRPRVRSRPKSRFATSTTTVKSHEENEDDFYGFIRKPNFNNAAALIQTTTTQESPVYHTPPKTVIQFEETSSEENASPEVQFVGQIRPKFTTEAPQELTTQRSRPIRTRVRVPQNKKVPSNEEQATRRSNQIRGRARGKSHYRAPENLKKESEEEENYPASYLKSREVSSTERSGFQITIDPAEEDQVPHSSIYSPQVVKNPDTQWVEASIVPAPNHLDEEMFEISSEDLTTVIPTTEGVTATDEVATTEVVEVTTKRRRKVLRKKGVWKLVKHKPVEPLESAESQNYLSVLNEFSGIEKGEKDDITTTTTTPNSLLDTLYNMLGFTGQAPNATNAEKVEVSTTTPSPTFPDEITVEPFTEELKKDEATTIFPETTEIVMKLNNDEVEPWKMKEIRTSTSTEVTHETEICYKGRCIKSKDDNPTP